MASIYRRPNSPFFWAAWNERAADGSTVRRACSTGERKNRSIALKLALALEEATADASRGILTVDRARSVLSRLTESCSGKRLDAVSVRQYFESWMKNKLPSITPGTAKRYGAVSRDFLAFLGKRADISLEHLQEADVIAFRDAECRASKSSRTVNLNVKVIRAILATAHKKGLVVRNAAAGVERVDGEAIQREPFSLAEFERLLAAAPDVEWRGLIMLGLYTGGRIGDLAHLTWANVDLVKGTLCFLPEKTKKSGKKVSLPLHPSLNAFLLSLPSVDDEAAPLFPKLAARKVAGEHGLSKTFARIMAAAGVDAMAVETGFKAKTGGKQKGKARKLARRSFHSLRHTAVSMMANAGVPEELRRKVTLHASGDVHAKYTHHEAATLRGAMDKLPKITSNQTPLAIQTTAKRKA